LNRRKGGPVTAEQSRAGAAASFAHGSAHEPVDHTRIGGQVEVIVGREIDACRRPERPEETALAQAVEPCRDAEVERAILRHWPWPVRRRSAACRDAAEASGRARARGWEWSGGGRPGTRSWRRPENRGPALRHSTTSDPRSA